jgi:hypothetical protein
MKMERTECSETSAHKIQPPGNYPEENTTYRTRRKFEIKKVKEDKTGVGEKDAFLFTCDP